MNPPPTLEQIARETAQALQDCYEYTKGGPNFDRQEGERIILTALQKVSEQSAPPPQVGEAKERATRKPFKTLFGVPFTKEQWEAMNVEPPKWELHPPQREEYEGDKEYAEGERDYADRVIAARKAKEGAADTEWNKLLLECADCAIGIRRNIDEDMGGIPDDDIWLTTIRAHAGVILENLMALRDLRSARRAPQSTK